MKWLDEIKVLLAVTAAKHNRNPWILYIKLDKKTGEDFRAWGSEISSLGFCFTHPELDPGEAGNSETPKTTGKKSWEKACCLLPKSQGNFFSEQDRKNLNNNSCTATKHHKNKLKNCGPTLTYISENRIGRLNLHPSQTVTKHPSSLSTPPTVGVLKKVSGGAWHFATVQWW